MININPLSLLKLRKLKSVAPHFAKIKLKEDYLHIKSIDSWIEQKLSGRYFISKIPVISENTLKSHVFIGFEDHAELSYFLLSCPHLRRN